MSRLGFAGAVYDGSLGAAQAGGHQGSLPTRRQARREKEGGAHASSDLIAAAPWHLPSSECPKRLDANCDDCQQLLAPAARAPRRPGPVWAWPLRGMPPAAHLVVADAVVALCRVGWRRDVHKVDPPLASISRLEEVDLAHAQGAGAVVQHPVAVA